MQHMLLTCQKIIRFYWICCYRFSFICCLPFAAYEKKSLQSFRKKCVFSQLFDSRAQCLVSNRNSASMFSMFNLMSVCSYLLNAGCVFCGYNAHENVGIVVVFLGLLYLATVSTLEIRSMSQGENYYWKPFFQSFPVLFNAFSVSSSNSPLVTAILCLFNDLVITVINIDMYSINSQTKSE